MDRCKLDKIISFYKQNEKKIRADVRLFQDECNIAQGVIPDIGLFATEILDEPGVMFIHLPMKEMNAGALYLSISEDKTYVFINTTKTQAETNFAIAHELYHVLFHVKNSKMECETVTDNYSELEEEYYANAFAGILLMPKEHFKITFQQLLTAARKLDCEDKNVYLVVILMLMGVYKTTYMSVVIRSIELFGELFADDIIEYLLDSNRKEFVISTVKTMGIYEDMLKPSYRNDTRKLIEDVKKSIKDKKEAGILDIHESEYMIDEFLDAIYECTGISIDNLDSDIPDVEV